MATPTPNPTPSSTSSTASSTSRPYPLYDAFLDLPHPGSSPSSSSGIRLIYPPSDDASTGIVDSLRAEELAAEFGSETPPPTTPTAATTPNAAANGQHGAPPQPQPIAPGAAKVARFAFPEYDDGTNAREVAKWQEARAKLGWTDATSANLTRRDGYLEGIYSLAGSTPAGTAGAVPGSSASGSDGINYGGPSPPGTDIALPSSHTFSHRLSNGTVVHGHVRRYLPYHATGGLRRDVGRRSPRALVLLTRNSGGGRGLYAGVLKSLEGFILQGGALGNEGEASESVDERLRWFLHSMHNEHLGLCRGVATAYSERRNNPPATGRQYPPVLAKPRILTLPLVELGRGHGLFGPVDSIKFAVPPWFLHGPTPKSGDIEGLSRNDLLPLLRCLGVPRTLRLLSALLSEKRILFTSASVEKLSAASYGAAALTAQGLLAPPSVFVPVLPPGLGSLLRSPAAYLIGVLVGPGDNYINLRSISDIGEVVLFDLDNPTANEPYFHNIADPRRSVPDLTQRVFDDIDSANTVSICDILYKDLTEVLKSDKKLFWQGAVQEKLGLAAAKGKKAASAAMRKGLKYLKGKSGKSSKDFDAEKGSERSAGTGDENAEDDLDEEGADQTQGDAAQSKLIGKGNYAYEQGFSNALAEEEARIALAVFFVGLYGDLRSYLTMQQPGTPPVVDKNKFVQYRMANGDAQGSGMFLLMNNFLRTATFDAFAAARLDEVQNRRAVAEDAPLFALVANHHRLNRIDFGMGEIRTSVRRVATDNDFPGRYLIKWDGVRNRVLALTSTQTFQGDYGRTLVELVENCRECSAILSNTLMVLWTRMQEGKGLQWKKTLLALQLLQKLLLNGPINAVIEAIDGFASIRALKSYAEALRGQNSKLVRDVSLEVYSLIVDPPVLFARRRALMNARRLAADPKPSPLRKETRMIRGMIGGFRNIHIALKPAGATVAPAPPAPAPVGDLLSQGTQPPAGVANGGYSNDLLSLSVAAAPTPASMNAAAVGMPPMTASSNAPQPGNYSNDLLALSFGPSPPQAATVVTGSGEKKESDPFCMQTVSQAMPKAGPPAAGAPTSQTPVAPQPAPFAMANHAPSSQPMHNGIQQQQPQQSKPQPMMNQPPMQTNQARPQQPTMSAPFSMANNAQNRPPQPMQQMPPPQQSQPMKSSIMNPPPMMMPVQAAQGGNFPPAYQQPGAGMGLAPNGYPAGPSMPPQQNSMRGFGPTAQGTQPNPMGAQPPPAGFPMMQQGMAAPAPQFQQSAMQQQPFPQMPGQFPPKP